jgi:hexosaminidase
MRVEPAEGVAFALTPATRIVTEPGWAAAADVGAYLARLLRPATGYPLPAGPAPAGPAPDAPHGAGAISLRLAGSEEAPGPEGYRLEVDADGVRLWAGTGAGLFRGVQTLRQLLPAAVERRGLHSAEFTVPGGLIVDRPRYAYRGVMLDVARHFFGIDDVKRLIDLAALYKVNHLHLHLTDDQGWRIAVDTWPRLATHGGGTEVGDGPGGYYTQAEFRELVGYAQRHYITVVPEIDLPGHTNAALASYPELTCDGQAPERYTGIEVGFSSLCAGNELTYKFLDDVFREVAALTPGPYLHLGGDEAKSTSPEEYATIVARAQQIVARHGKTAIGWQEITAAPLAADTLLQVWDTTTADPKGIARAAANGNRIILSPADRSYLDMKYDASSPVGLSWAGYVPVARAYGWDPATHLPGVDPDAIAGVESPLWTETARSRADLEFLAFPRLAVIAEIGWSPAPRQDWTAFRERLAGQAGRWDALGVAYHRAPDVPWPPAP